LHVVHRAIVDEAASRGVVVRSAELVGLVPADAVIGAARAPLGLDALGPEHVLELRVLRGIEFADHEPS
jgi:glutamate formiminotransferase